MVLPDRRLRRLSRLLRRAPGARLCRQIARRRGFDVSVGGVAAYSTLGHFNDPILNTMMGWSDVELASIIFHELTHQMMYVPNDADFNEALATTVEEEGVRRWLQAQGRDAGSWRTTSCEQQHYHEVMATVDSNASRSCASCMLRESSARSCASARAPPSPRCAHSYAQLKADWGGHAPFEAWFEADLNNAHLASVATYFDCVPGFKRELDAVGGNLQAFYRRVRALARLDQARRDALVCGERESAAGP